MISSWTTKRCCFTQLQEMSLHFTTARGTCTCGSCFQHSDADLARDPLSTNRRLVDSEELELSGTMVVAGATSNHIKVLIPDTFSGPTVNANSPVLLQHMVGLTLGPAVDLSSSLPAPNLERALCRNSILPTLNKRRNSY